jgi:IS66 C-terminal element
VLSVVEDGGRLNYAEPIAGRLPEKTSPLGIVRCSAQSAKLNGHDPWAYLKDVFERLPTLKQRDLAQLLPHNWRPASDTAVLNTAPAAAAA